MRRRDRTRRGDEFRHAADRHDDVFVDLVRRQRAQRGRQCLARSPQRIDVGAVAGDEQFEQAVAANRVRNGVGAGGERLRFTIDFDDEHRAGQRNGIAAMTSTQVASEIVSQATGISLEKRSRKPAGNLCARSAKAAKPS